MARESARSAPVRPRVILAFIVLPPSETLSPFHPGASNGKLAVLHSNPSSSHAKSGVVFFRVFAEWRTIEWPRQGGGYSYLYPRLFANLQRCGRSRNPLIQKKRCNPDARLCVYHPHLTSVKSFLKTAMKSAKVCTLWGNEHPDRGDLPRK